MNNYYQTGYQQAQYPVHTTLSSNSAILNQAWRLGVTGAVVGGVIAVSHNIRQHNKGESEISDVVRDTAKEATSTGVAAMAGSMAVSATGINGLLGAVLFVGATVGAKYLIDGAISKD